MIERAFIHVTGPRGSGKTTFVEAILRSLDADVLVARCVRDDRLRNLRESASKSDPELGRCRRAGAVGAAKIAVPGDPTDYDAFFMTDLMTDYSHAVVIEGDNPLEHADLTVFVGPPLPADAPLFVRSLNNRGAQQRATIDVAERFVRHPDGATALMAVIFGREFLDLVRSEKPHLAENLRTRLLSGVDASRPLSPPPPVERWTVAEGYGGIEQAQMVIINVRGEEERPRAERLVADLVRLRKDDSLFADILGPRGHRIPITAVVANLAHPKDPGRRKAIARVKRALRMVRGGS